MTSALVSRPTRPVSRRPLRRRLPSFLLGVCVLASALGWTSEALATATVNKQFSPATVDPGDISRFRITLANSSLVALTAAAVTDNLPANIKIANPASPTNTCGFTGVTADPGTARIVLTGGTVPAAIAATGTDGQCYFELNVVSTVAGNWINTIPKNGPSNGFTPGGTTSGFQATENAVSITNTTDAIATLSVRALSPPTGTKSYTPSAGLVGQPFALGIVLTNPNPNTTLPLTSFTDTLPAGMKVAPTPAATVNCTGTGAVNGTFAPAAGSGALTLEGGTIGQGATCTLTVNAVVASITGLSQSFANTVPANAIGNTRGLGSATFNRSITVASPVSVSKSFNPTMLRAGQTASLTLTISNSASATVPLAITRFTDKLPAGLTIAASGTKTVACTTGTAGTLTAVAGSDTVTLTDAATGVSSSTAANRRCTIVVPVTATAAGSYPNTTSNTAPDTVITNSLVAPNPLPVPAASATLEVNSQLTVAKTVSATTAAPGETVVFNVTLSNWSSGALGGVAFTDNLPLVGSHQMVVASPGATLGTGCSGGSFSGAAGSAVVTWTGGTVAGGSGANAGTCTISIPATLPAGAPSGTVFSNAIPAGSITGNGGVSNTNAVAVNVATVSAVSVAKAFSPASVAQGQSSTLTVTLSNATATPVTGAALTDTLPTSPGPVVVAATPSVSTTCTGGSVTAVPGSGSVAISGATIPANGSCNFKVNVTGSTVGTHANTIPIGALTSNQGATNPSAASANLTVTTGITGSKSFTPSAVSTGGVSRVTIQINNTTPAPLTNVSVTDPATANLTIANPANASTTCAGPTSITAVPGTGVAQLTGATLAAGGNCLFLFDVVGGGTSGNWVNTIPAGSIVSAEGPQNTASISATLTRNTTTSIGINKSFDPVIVSGGQPSVLRIDVTNPIGSPSGADNVTFTDNLPTGIEVYGVPNASTTCANGVVTAVPGSATVKLSGATLPANSTCSVYVTTTSVKFLNLSNTIPASAISSTQGYTNALATTATLSTLQGLGTSKSFTPTSISAGQTATLKIRLYNTRDPGLANPTLTGVSFTDRLPAGLTVAATPNASTTCANGIVTAASGSDRVTLSSATINVNTDCLVQVDVTASNLGVYTNTIPKETVTSNEGLKNPNDAVATLNVLNPPVVSKTFSPAAVKAGEVSTLTVTIVNANAQTLSGAALTDNLPSGLTVANPPNASTTCSGGSVAAAVAGTTVALTNATLAANGTCTFRADVVSNVAGSYPNSIPVGALTTGAGVTNTAPAGATLTVLQPPTVTKDFSPATIAVGQTSVLTIALGNANASPLTLVSPLIDTLPGTLRVADPSDLAGTCTLGSVAAVAGTNTITYASGATIPVGGCTIQVRVTGDQAGSNQNLIPASGLDTNAGANQTPGAATLTLTAVALGNRVWLDDGAGGGVANDGKLNGSEAGIDGAPVALYRASDNTLASTTVTANGGYYWFDNLPPGAYYAVLPASGFATGQALAGLLSSTGAGNNTTLDQLLDENGVDDLAPATNGIRSNTFNLTVGGEPTGENQNFYPGTLLDNSVNATNDFALYNPRTTLVALGNRVWLDNGAGGGVANDGKLNGSEAGIDNVTVELRRAGDGSLATTTVTAGGGNYWFDNLLPGSYYVVLPAAEFLSGDLQGLISSSGAGTSLSLDQTSDENGIDDASPSVNGLRSNVFTLSVGGEPGGEPQSGYAGVLPDNSVNATNDFGLYNPATTLVALGNRVWLDNGAGGGVANDGKLNGSEAGIDNVTVELHRAGDGSLVATTVTAMGGFYYFDNLLPGDYYALLPASEFGAGQELLGLLSASGAGSNASSDQSLDENGIDDANAKTNGIRSNVFTLSVGGAPTDDDQTHYPGILPNANVNATNDFALIEPAATLVAIGNRVWLDNGAGGGVANDGKLNGAEAGIDGVTLELYDSANTRLATTGTAGGGRYYFDNLAPGVYTVRIPASEFGTGRPLAGLLSSTGAGTDRTINQELDENGIDDPNPAANGIASMAFTLAVGQERTGEGQTNYPGVLPDANVNATNDFGFYNPLTTNVAIGNRVWLDNGAGGGVANDGKLNGAEAGIDGVEVRLYTGSGTLVTHTTTANGGYYWFDDLPAGQYTAFIPESEFAAGRPLEGLLSSSGAGNNTTVDQGLDENGIDNARPAVDGIRSNLFDLQPGTAPTDDDQSRYPGALPNNSVNATNDFGFIPPAQTLVAIGNRVFLDNGAGGGIANNGKEDGGELGLVGVAVDLYDAANRLIASTVTAACGCYYFDNLVPGVYTVRIPASEFGAGRPLAGLLSSSGAGSSESDDHPVDENGIDNANPAANGIASMAFTLAVGTEPTGENQASYTGVLPDANVNATDDFGFYNPLTTNVAIGNRVWLDDGAGGGTANDGILNGAEAGIDGVRVELYSASNALVTAATTANGGHYWFDNLAAGQYYVRIPASEFGAAKPLAGLFSSSGAGTATTADQNIDENGIDDTNPAAHGIQSRLFNLQPGAEPENEDQGFYAGNLPDNSVNGTDDFGFIPPAATLVAIGNRVWLDNGAGGVTANDGKQTGSEPGVEGVLVQLLDASDRVIGSATTTAGGDFWFDNLVPGAYRVRVPASEFGPGRPLAGLKSSAGSGTDKTIDQGLDENGIDDPSPQVNGIVSMLFNLAVGAEPTGENQASYTGVLPDANVNATDDFGFYNPQTTDVAIGNRVWLDDGAGGGTANDGILNGGEAGIDGVAVELYSAAGIRIGTTVTADGGFYYFDNLAGGQYYVSIPASEFAVGKPLAGRVSSSGAGNNKFEDQSVDENGIDNASPATNGIRSNLFALQPGTEPAAEDQAHYPGTLPDTSVNATIDFGFIDPKTTLVAIGNRVWLDNGAGTGGIVNDGKQNGGEPGIANVAVELRRASNNALVGTSVTDADGRYYFDNLVPGDYYVLVPAVEFQPGGHLADLSSSTGAGSSETDDQELDENGIDNPNPATFGIRSNAFTLNVGAEPTGENQASYTGVLPDANVNATDDFGFYNPATTYVALGNRVWLDDGAGGGVANDGRLGGSESGIDGVAVELRRVADNALVTTATTANGGLYWFDRLLPGDYYVVLPAGNFAAGQPLQGLSSSTGAGNDKTADEAADENGIDDAAAASNGLRSNAFSLRIGEEPTDDDQSHYPGSLPNANVNATNDFGLFNPATTYVAVGNRVWLDSGIGGGSANNGKLDGAETGIDGVRVELYRASDNSQVTSTTTAGGGFYFFDNLPPGDYYILLPAAEFADGSALAGLSSSAGAGSDLGIDQSQDENGIDAADPKSAGIRSGVVALAIGAAPVGEDQTGYTGVLADNSVAGTVDFGLFNGAQTSIGSFIWNDANGNGIQDAGESGVPGASVRLLDSSANPAKDSNGVEVPTQVTGTDGLYRFAGLPPGVYQVEATVPAGYRPTPTQAGDPVNASTGANVVAGDSNIASSPSAGVYRSALTTLTVGAEPIEAGGLPGDDQDAAADANGNMTVDFGFVQAASLGSFVWSDTNGDGLQTAGEPGLAGATVVLLDRNGNPATAIDGQPVPARTTGSDGLYYFSGLAPGSYLVEVTPPPGYAPTANQSTDAIDAATGANLVAGDSNIASSPSAGVYRSALTTLTVGAEPVEAGGLPGDDQDATADANGNMTVDFGFQLQRMSLGSLVWRDLNGDGLQSPAEPGIAGIVVRLLDGSGNPAVDLDGAPVASQTTLADGLFFFDNLAPGTYRVEATAPSGYLPTLKQSTGIVNASTGANIAANDSNIDSQPSPGVYRSGAITLAAGKEPVEATGVYAGDDRDNGADADANGNMTVDFGFLVYDLALRKTVLALSDEPLIPGTSTATFQIEVFNQGDIDALGVELIDYVPTGLGYEPALNTQTAIPTNPGDWGAGPNPTLVIPAIAPGASKTVRIVLKVQTGTLGQALINTAEIAASDGGSYVDRDSTADSVKDNDALIDDVIDNSGGDEDDHDSAQVQVQVFDLALRKTLVGSSDTPAIPGLSKVTFEIEAINQGDVAASAVKVVDYVQPGFTFDAADNAKALTGNASDWTIGTAAGPEIQVGNIAPAASVKVRIVLRLGANTFGQTLRNFAEIGSDGKPAGTDRDSTADSLNQESPVKDDVLNEDARANPGTDDEDDHDVATFGVETFDLALRKRVATLSSNPPIPGASTATFAIEVFNQGDLPASNVEVTDYVQSGFGFDAAKNTAALTGNPADWTESVPGKPKTAIPGPIPAGGSATVRIVLDVQAGTAGQTLVNRAEISDDGEPAGADSDSTADDSDGETPVKDDVLNENAKANPGTDDEDDHDVAQVKVEDRVAIGNLVFLDANDNGRFDQGDSGVNGVVVELFAQGADPSLAQPLATATTAGGGFYWFDALTAGRYFVHIPPSQFQPGKPLERMGSSTGAGGDDGTDDTLDENGIDGADPMTRGVSSAVVELTAGAEPVQEAGQGAYSGALPDASVDATIDFGFKVQKTLSCSVICDVVAPFSKVDNADITEIAKRRNRVVVPGAANSGDCLPDGRITVDDAAACRAYRN